MTLNDVLRTAIEPALAILPHQMDTPEARVMLLSIGLQESRFAVRRQMGGGPARGFWQCEQGTQSSRGGVWGFFLHPASRYWMSVLCAARGIAFTPAAIYNALDKDDVLAAGVARLGLFTDPRRLPATDDVVGSWALYQRVWRPGKPKPDTWPDLHAQAVAAVQMEAA
ncbi:hypothetical protein [Caballeronia grimmiae]|uniref:Uncharacterized protein n=1 Tax=Caballeronia grimmiae TaxID=1071679 RepID=A0A069P2B6_9BURK|nr:hypothetical protein [Caballeronia grimmiae]KDR34708.1 hypothetical protein BG57_03745 [Caballeronia grimmiae]GGD63581.1 hypothetical protein GCM10010985_17020 [Caballeronia grimmiae]